MSETRILLSYHYYHKLDLTTFLPEVFPEHPLPRIFIDSGGFSAFTKGTTIDLEEYAAFLERHRGVITTYANLDAIGDAEQTWRNQQRLEARGLSPVPVFHVGEDWRYLERYLDRYPYIALGGMVPYLSRPNMPKLMPWLVRCFKLAQGADGRPRAVYHGFGATNWEVVKAFPWYSVDSSSWCAGFMYGTAKLFNERTGKLTPLPLGDHEKVYVHREAIRRAGFDPGTFADRARSQRALLAAISVHSFQQAEAWQRRYRGTVRLPTRPDATATPLGADGRPLPEGLCLYLAEVVDKMVDVRSGLRVIQETASARR